MKILLAPDAFKESVAAAEVAAALARGLQAVLPQVECVLVPVADGGEGTAATLVAATGGRLIEVTVDDPLGRPVRVHYGRLGDGKSAVIELAQASGLARLHPAERDPLKTSSHGTGALIRHAIAAGARHIIVGLGGSATNDGGAGLLQALGARFYDAAGGLLETPLTGGTLDRVRRCDLDGLHASTAGVVFEVACDVDNPLCGPHGASAVFGPQKGATPDVVAALDASLGAFHRRLERRTGRPAASVAGAGAAGGAGAALLGGLGAHLRPGVELVLDALEFDARLVGVDLVITGEGGVDAQTVRGKAPAGVARAARARHIPVVIVGGGLADDVDRAADGLFDALEGCIARPQSLAQALAAGPPAIERAGRRVGLWLRLGQRLGGSR